jgi:hypothetical protein
MPTYDGAHYFLTVLAPIRTKEIKDGETYTSPVHALRKRLDMLAPAAQSPACCHRQSPFALSQRTHFARFVIIDDVAYPGRLEGDTLLGGDVTLTVAQPQDHLSCPFLLFSVDFDAKSGADEERNSYLVELWNAMKEDLRKIFEFCEGFDPKMTEAASFAAYIASCQLETTMSFNDYYAYPPALPAWPKDAYVRGIKASAIALVVGILATLLLLLVGLFTPSWQSWLPYTVGLSLVGAVVLVVIIVVAYMSVMAAGAKPFPSAPDSDLPTVLKSLHLQRQFTRFAIDSQMQAVGTDAASAQKLYDDFKAFVAANKPQDPGAPTQAPGVIGI